ncbi:MAG: phosphoglycerate kinase [Patescibacteria group bacterium]|nr:phosphoglycerate kinase [Patescibacteria group bacterium]
MKYLKSLGIKDLAGKTCLLRIDLNLKSLSDQFRVDAVLPTIKYLLSKKTKIIILSHRGRPVKKESSLSLKPIAKIVSHKLGMNIKFIPELDLKKIKKIIEADNKNKVFMLENLRFLPGEEKNDAVLAKQLAELGNLYINDAFAVSHRKNASLVAITNYIKSFAGLLLEKEISGLTKATRNPQKPLIVILGGTKLEDKITIIRNLANKTKYFLFGSSFLNEIKDPKFVNLIKNKKIIIPVDSVMAGNSYFDIGPQTANFYSQIINSAKTIIWNGPVGKTEEKKYSKGSRSILLAITRTKGFKVIGGGETANFVIKNNLQKKISLLSTGGGAMLDFLSGKKLPGIAALERSVSAKNKNL